MITAIVLCGGRSTRMGRDKGALRFGEDTMLTRVLRIAGSIADHVILVSRAEQASPAGITVIHDPVEDLGPLAGIAAGLAASTTDLNVIVACDMPLINAGVLERMVTLIGDSDACVAVADGHASALCGVYRARVAAEARSLLESGERRVMKLLDAVATKRVDAALFRDLDPDLTTFVSVDTPEKYADAVARLTPDPADRSSR